jgi:hypothetical protein
VTLALLLLLLLLPLSATHPLLLLQLLLLLTTVGFCLLLLPLLLLLLRWLRSRSRWQLWRRLCPVISLQGLLLPLPLLLRLQLLHGFRGVPEAGVGQPLALLLPSLFLLLLLSLLLPLLLRLLLPLLRLLLQLLLLALVHKVRQQQQRLVQLVDRLHARMHGGAASGQHVRRQPAGASKLLPVRAWGGRAKHGAAAGLSACLQPWVMQQRDAKL